MHLRRATGGELLLQLFTLCIFTARRYSSAVYAVVVCLSVSPCVCPSVRYTPVLYQNG